eukprot:m.286983 g.286983  ORF g.286983 m.286983 type:complete len:80 (-) comp19442_c1_seq9:30-269(-)
MPRRWWLRSLLTCPCLVVPLQLPQYCVHFHDPEGELFGCLDAETNSARIEWVKLTPDLVMNDSQRVLVRLLLRFCRETS